MSKLILLISLMMSFIAIKAYAATGEDQIKAKCYKEAGNRYGDNPKSPYQMCLRANGIVRVERNVSGSDDKSKTDARICNAANPLCSKCIGLYGSGDAKSARTKITECVQREENKQRQAQRPKPKSEPTINGGQLQEVRITAQAPCSKTNPRHCKTVTACEANNGVWNGEACAAAPCPEGTTPDPRDSKYCVCNTEMTPHSIERGSSQQCPAMCKAEDHKQYNTGERSCVCTAGYEDRTGLGICVSTAAPAPQVAACIQELQDKITACNTASTVAVDKCDPSRKSGDGDTLDALQGLLKGASTAGSAVGNCGQAAVAGTTGYYAIEELRGKCDTEISACKTSCSDATAFINANKDRVYQECRAKAWADQECAAPWATPYRSFTEPAFNDEWDGVNKAPFDQQIQAMQTSITDYNSKCEAGGTADSNRDKMTYFMDDMNSAFKSAKQCECQLGSGGNCDNQVGPAECAGNPSLPGCSLIGVNCLSATDNSPKCVCFKNPNSDECKNIKQTNNNQKINSADVSSFAGIGGSTPGVSGFTGDTSGKTGDVNVGDLSDLGADGEAIGASGTVTADAGSPFGAAAGGGGAGAGGGSGGGVDGATAATSEEDESTGKKLGGLFDVAKSALGNLFKKGKDDKGTYDPVTGKYIDGANANSLDSKKWRPRGMVRGLAGNNTEIGGKFEDIWKVMNKQYKVQDQKDSFIFGGEK